jgi:hypothetical protein
MPPAPISTEPASRQARAGADPEPDMVQGRQGGATMKGGYSFTTKGCGGLIKKTFEPRLEGFNAV